MRINCPLTTSIVETVIDNYFKIEFDTTEFNDSNSTFPFHFYVYYCILSTKKNYWWWNFIAYPFHILNYILTLFSNEILEEQPSFPNFDWLDSIRLVEVNLICIAQELKINLSPFHFCKHFDYKNTTISFISFLWVDI